MKEMLPRTTFRYTNETVGLFVLLALLLFVAGFLYSGKIRNWFNPGETLKVVLPDDGLSGLSAGSAIQILGTRAGEVQKIVINPDQKIHAIARIDSDMTVFVRTDSTATIRRTFGIAGDAFLEITRGSGPALDWEFAVLSVESDRTTTDSLSELIDELREKVLPVIEDAHIAIIALTEVSKNLQDPDRGLQQLLASLNSITAKIDSGEGSLGRLLAEDKLIRDLEARIAQMGPILDEAQVIIENISAFSTEFDTESGDIPQITRSLKTTMASLESVMADIRATTPQLPKIAENVGDTANTIPILVLQMQQVMVELEQLIRQLQSHWLFGGRSGQPSQTTNRLPPQEVRP